MEIEYGWEEKEEEEPACEQEQEGEILFGA
jgi:hypothetical protein